MKIVDAHCHIYPDKIAAKAVQSVGEFYNIEMSGDGSAGALLECQQAAGIDYSIVHSVAMRPQNVTAINDFIAEQCRLHPSFIGFATMHQDFEDMEGEVERAIALGLRGFKLHPDSQGVNIDDPRLMRFYEMIEGRLPVMLHCGDYRYDYSHPRRTKNICRSFPDLVMNAAHFGAWSLYDLAVEYLEDEHCFMDVSSASVYLGPRRTRELIEIYGPERILFGSDFPMWDPAEEVVRFASNALPGDVAEQICWRNPQRYLGFALD